MVSSKELSISINLLLPKTRPNKQYEFKPPTTDGSYIAPLIIGNTDRAVQKRALFNAAAAIGNKESINLIRDIAQSHPSELTRAAAWSSLLNSSAALNKDFALALEDSSEYVRSFIEKMNVKDNTA